MRYSQYLVNLLVVKPFQQKKSFFLFFNARVGFNSAISSNLVCVSLILKPQPLQILCNLLFQFRSCLNCSFKQAVNSCILSLNGTPSSSSTAAPTYRPAVSTKSFFWRFRPVLPSNKTQGYFRSRPVFLPVVVGVADFGDVINGKITQDTVFHIADLGGIDKQHFAFTSFGFIDNPNAGRDLRVGK